MANGICDVRLPGGPLRFLCVPKLVKQTPREAAWCQPNVALLTCRQRGSFLVTGAALTACGLVLGGHGVI